MDSFEDLGILPELVEMLAAEGIERPTSLQSAAVQVIRRGNNVVLRAGPGAGTLVAWGAALLDRIAPEGRGPSILVLTPTPEGAARLAESLGRLAVASGHTVAALGTPWALAGHAHVLFGTPTDVLAATRAGTVSLASVQATVLDQADRVDKLGSLHEVEEVLEFVPKECQRVVSALPLTPPVEDFVERHVRRSTVVPLAEQAPVSRGSLRYRIVSEPKDEGVLITVSELLDGETRHALVYCRNEDRAADLGDYLTLHGFMAGAPGDPELPVWLGVDEIEGRERAEGHEGVTILSADVPADEDSLDRRHHGSDGGVVLVLPREMAHLRDVSKRTGYALAPLPFRDAQTARSDIEALRERLARAIAEEDVEPYLLALEPLFERYDAAEVAAAAVAMLRKKPAAPAAPPRPSAPSEPNAPIAWAKLFMSVGERDGLRPGDLLGAIVGDTGIQPEKVGKIEIRESFTLVEVDHGVAHQVIQAVNGTTIKGRAVRADFDRGGRGRQSGRPSKGGRPPRRS